MVDYVKSTGAGGTMLIRDKGLSVEFHIQAGYTATWVGEPGFHTDAYVNGAWRGLPNVSSYSNKVWRYLGAHNAVGNQNVCFHIDASGTEGFGGPTDFWVAINRATVPPAPIPGTIDKVGHTSMRVQFSGNGDGGSPIREWQVGYAYTPKVAKYTMPSSGTSTLESLDVGSLVYIWYRGRNDVGWGPWSARVQQRTLASGRIRDNGTYKEFVLYVKVAGKWRQAILFIKTGGIRKAASG